MTTTTPTADNSSATTDVSTTDELVDIAIDIIPNGGDRDTLCWQSYGAVVDESLAVLEDACAGEI